MFFRPLLVSAFLFPVTFPVTAQTARTETSELPCAVILGLAERTTPAATDAEMLKRLWISQIFRSRIEQLGRIQSSVDHNETGTKALRAADNFPSNDFRPLVDQAMAHVANIRKILRAKKISLISREYANLRPIHDGRPSAIPKVLATAAWKNFDADFISDLLGRLDRAIGLPDRQVSSLTLFHLFNYIAAYNRAVEGLSLGRASSGLPFAWEHPRLVAAVNWRENPEALPSHTLVRRLMDRMTAERRLFMLLPEQYNLTEAERVAAESLGISFLSPGFDANAAATRRKE